MSLAERKLILLGPQPEHASLRVVLSQLQLTAPVATITAGWETEESLDEPLNQAIGMESINLNLFARSEKLFEDDPELIQLLQDRQDELRHLRDAYNDRLHHLLTAARQIANRQSKWCGNLIDNITFERVRSTITMKIDCIQPTVRL